MTQVELDNWVARISYKPGWELRASFVQFHEGNPLVGQKVIRITVGFYGESSAPPHKERGIFHTRCAIYDGNFDTFVSDAIQAIHELENHETREFFKVDGKQWLAPHNSRAIYLVI